MPHTPHSEHWLRAVIESSPDGVLVVGLDQRIWLLNQHFLDLWGLSGASWQTPLPIADCWAQLRTQLARHSTEDGFDLDPAESHAKTPRRFETRDGRWLERRVHEHQVDGRACGWVVHWSDVTEVHLANRAAHYERDLMHALMDNVPDQIYFKDAESRFIRINPSLARRYGLSDPSQAVGKSDADFYTAEHAAQTASEERRIMQTGVPVYNQLHHEIWSDGREAWNLSTKMPLRDSQGEVVGTFGISHDITEHKQQEARIWRQANFDSLTGLPNRRMLRDRCQYACLASQRSGHPVAVLMIDLDHFKVVNDTLGHDKGDELLIEAAQRIGRVLRHTDTVARMGGDEFAVVLTELSEPDMAAEVAQKIVQTMAAPITLGQEQVFVSASIGIALYPRDATELDDLFKKADQAMYLAKAQGRDGFRFFTPDLQSAAERRMRLSTDLHRALAQQELQLVYQPIVCLRSGRISRAEALLRWQHPTLGPIAPSEFIPLAEATNLIVDLGEWVFEAATAQLQRWRGTLDPAFGLSINLSALQFKLHSQKPRGLDWHHRLQQRGLPGSALAIEITESLLLEPSDTVRHALRQLQETGCPIALDDFGTGYSALSYLHQHHFDIIKLDAGFVRELGPEHKSLALCKAIIVMAHELGIQVVAEGVETALQLELLRDAGCDFAQGYWWSAGLPAAELEAWLGLYIPVAAPKQP